MDRSDRGSGSWPPGAWDEIVQDGYAFQDPLNGGVWILVYRGYNSQNGSYQVGLATSSDGTTFTRKNNGGVNDGLFPNFGANYDVLAVMLVGTTYYVYVNGSPGHNSTNVYYSTDDFRTLSAYDQNPIFVNAFCPAVWNIGGYYYMLYGLASPYPASSTLNSTATTTHSVSLTGLSLATKYHFAVKSSNGTLSASPDQTFTTAAGN